MQVRRNCRDQKHRGIFQGTPTPNVPGAFMTTASASRVVGATNAPRSHSRAGVQLFRTFERSTRSRRVRLAQLSGRPDGEVTVPVAAGGDAMWLPEATGFLRFALGGMAGRTPFIRSRCGRRHRFVDSLVIRGCSAWQDRTEQAWILLAAPPGLDRHPLHACPSASLSVTHCFSSGARRHVDPTSPRQHLKGVASGAWQTSRVRRARLAGGGLPCRA